MKNWKSFIAFFLFIIIYAYTAFNDKSADVIWNTGLVALLALLAIMSRSQTGVDVMKAVLELVKGRAK